MSKFIDITGKRFGKLTVLNRSDNSKHGASRWTCMCDCGEKTIVLGSSLKNGRTKSCGCLTVISNKKRSKHGLCDTVEYQAWSDMIARCNNPEHASYKNYGGRGITVDTQWLNFSNFINDMGNKPSSEYSLDRIDNDLGYSKKNCRWTTIDIQNRNKRNSVLLTYNNKSLCLADWVNEEDVKILNLSYNTLHERLLKGWTDEQILTTPKYKRLT